MNFLPFRPALMLLIPSSVFGLTTNDLKWVATGGAAVQGDFLGVDAESVTILRNGTELTIPFAKLASESVTQAKNLANDTQSLMDEGTPLPVDGSFPKEKAWLKGEGTRPPTKAGHDQVFLVDRGWAEGRLVAIREKDVLFEKSGKTYTLPRSGVSLVQVSDFLDPAKRRDAREVKIRLEISGGAVNGELNFEKGTIVKSVDAEPVYTVGKDDDDQVKVRVDGLIFDKQGSDSSITTIVTDLTLLVPAETLNCDLLCYRSNYDTGSYNVRFLNPKDGSEMVTLKRPTHGMWTRIEIPVSKLAAGSKGYRSPVISFGDLDVRTVQPLPMSEKTGTLGGAPKSRISLMDFTIVSGVIVGMDANVLRVLQGSSTKPVYIPRWKVALIELNDWQTEWAGKKPADADTTVPMTVSFAGGCGVSNFNLPPEDTITTLIAAPHFLTGWDHDDNTSIRNERGFGINKTAFDRTFAQTELTVVFNIKSPVNTTVKVTDAFVNDWAGDLSLSIWKTLDQAKVGNYLDASQGHLAGDLTIPRSKWFGQ